MPLAVPFGYFIGLAICFAFDGFFCSRYTIFHNYVICCALTMPFWSKVVLLLLRVSIRSCKFPFFKSEGFLTTFSDAPNENKKFESCIITQLLITINMLTIDLCTTMYNCCGWDDILEISKLIYCWQIIVNSGCLIQASTWWLQFSFLLTLSRWMGRGVATSSFHSKMTSRGTS